jgi:hypothetical protein
VGAGAEAKTEEGTAISRPEDTAASAPTPSATNTYNSGTIHAEGAVVPVEMNHSNNGGCYSNNSPDDEHTMIILSAEEGADLQNVTDDRRLVSKGGEVQV